MTITSSFPRHLKVLLHSIAVCGSLLGLFFYWFAIANRFHIFLYNHLGASPFDARTISRYWMAGLVADGFVLLGYTLGNWFWARIMRIRYRPVQPPRWWDVWLICIIPITTGIFWIITTQNMPMIPLPIATKITGITLLGLPLALIPGRLAANFPAKGLGLATAGLGLIPAFLVLRVVELVPVGNIDLKTALVIGIGSTLIGGSWTIGVVWGLQRLNIIVSHIEIFLAGATWSYLLLPVLHYILLTPAAYHYISVAGNFFAKTWMWQGICWGTAIGISLLAHNIQSRSNL